MIRGYSDVMEKEIIKEFRWRGHFYVWDDKDRVYYNLENDAEYPILMDVPGDAY